MHTNGYRKKSRGLIFVLLQFFPASFANDNPEDNKIDNMSTCTSTTTSNRPVPPLIFKRPKSHSLEEIESTLILTQSQLESAREQLSSARKDLEIAEKELAETGRTLDSFRTVIKSARTARSISEPNNTQNHTINFISARELRGRHISESEFVFYMGITPCPSNISVIFNRKKSTEHKDIIDQIYVATPHLCFNHNDEAESNNETESNDSDCKEYIHNERYIPKKTYIPLSYYVQFCKNFMTIVKEIPEIIENGTIKNCEFNENNCNFKIDYTEELFFRLSARYYIYIRKLEELRTSLVQNKLSLKKIRRLKKSLSYIDLCGNEILISILHYDFKALQKKRKAQRAQEIKDNKITPPKKIIRFWRFKNGVLSQSEPIISTPPPLTEPTPPNPPPAPPKHAHGQHIGLMII